MLKKCWLARFNKMSEIKKIKAREILNSKGNWTVEAEVQTNDGLFRAQVPSGTSVGKYEAKDAEPQKAVANIEKIIAPKLKGQDPAGQKKIDQLLIELDGTEDKSRLGANAILAVSVACCRAGSAAKKLPLYHHILQLYENGFRSIKLPRACFNILNGGAHADSDLDIQEFMIVPQMASFKENLRAGVKIYHTLKNILEKKFGKLATNVGDEGGFVPPIKKPERRLI